MSIVEIHIVATRGTTMYQFKTVQEAYPGSTGAAAAYSIAQDDATKFEQWLSAQPDRQDTNDRRSLERST